MYVFLEMSVNGAPWEPLGRLSATDRELAEWRAIFDECADPFDAIEQLPENTLLRDMLDVTRLEGHQVRVSFVQEH
jgi:hypothetical protein